jgi:hypothetical protein
MVEVLIAVIVVVGVGWWLSRKRKTQGRMRSQPHSSKAIPNHLMQKLDRLTRDRRVSERLIERIALEHPGRSRQWCVEKAIYDIQRDRRS